MSTLRSAAKFLSFNGATHGIDSEQARQLHRENLMATLLGPDGRPFHIETKDVPLLGIVLRGSSIHILTNRELIKKIEFDDKRKVAEQLRKIFEQDFGVLL